MLSEELDFTRKPGGGLAAHIEVLEAFADGDADNTELLMLLIELRSLREQLAELKGERVPVAVVELNDNLTVAEIRGDIPRRKAVRELYEGALVIGQELFTAAKPAGSDNG